MEFDLFSDNCCYHTCRPRIANVHALLKASGPERHPFEDSK